MPIDAELYPWFSAAALAWGILDCFFGYSVFKLTLALWGAVIGAIFGQAAGTALDWGVAGQIGGLIAGALIGGGIAFLLYLVAVFFAGFCFGFTFGVLLLANYQQNVALLTGCVLGVIGGVLAVKLQRAVLILATALLGSFRALLALMYFTHKLDWLFYFQKPQQLPGLVDSHPWLLPAALTLAAVGAVAQFEIGGGKSPGKKKDKKKANETKD